ncbi:MBL fold metallo-hydrolase [Roseomonas stagni]|uniref:MBL fold metallo-hydrolase n=1 Tax=Falsiroseomonas algicola TaxID=2716930 RepID=A0A6M1LFT3_9PROT|nr:MBL fold metallo-hydrolase [Falsiroseomonas algicola]NGM19002.1 MBL fold metallo-hydrolase [Falsiroseomonas algicola]
MAVTLTFCGAARTVTGSCLLFDTGATRFLVDCGMFQGPKTLKALNHEPFPFDPRGIDFVLLTHAHIDHSGLLPKLVKQGFRGRIHATPATTDLCSVMLPDSGHIQETEVEQLNRRNRRRGRDGVLAPIYTAADAERAMGAFSPIEPGAWLTPGKGIRARWWPAGHMLGAASIEIEVAGPPALRMLVSGDIGPDIGGLQSGPEGPAGLDHVICESTYGDEDRPVVTPEARRAELAKLVRWAAERQGTMLIPSFAVERAQEVVFDLVRLMQEGLAPRALIHIDSPLASRATRIFTRHAAAMPEGAAMRDALASPLVRHVQDANESRELARAQGFGIVLAGSGMCEAGRIRHHLKQHLHEANALVTLVGYQATGTLGRLLQDGARRVRIQGETFGVAARIAMMQGYSGHADGPELGRWIAARGPVSGGVFLVHGEEEAIEGLAKRVEGRGIVPADRILRPVLDQSYTLAPGAAPVAIAAPGRRGDAAAVGRPDWHNARAALLLGIEDAIERAPDEASRSALLERLRQALQ